MKSIAAGKNSIASMVNIFGSVFNIMCKAPVNAKVCLLEKLS